MESLKKAFRSVCFVLIILLASTGAGLAGGIPLPTFRRREDQPVAIELFELDKTTDQKASEEQEEGIKG